jgi:hypothetical protein
MTPLAMIEAIATALWAYMGVMLVIWIRHWVRASRQNHIPIAMDLLLNLVPAMAILVGVILVGSVVGLPSVVALIAILFPMGLCYGLYTSLADLEASTTHIPQHVRRIGLSLGIAIVVIYVRQFT